MLIIHITVITICSDAEAHSLFVVVRPPESLNSYNACSMWTREGNA
jgi:hypothetical protein